MYNDYEICNKKFFIIKTLVKYVTIASILSIGSDPELLNVIFNANCNRLLDLFREMLLVIIVMIAGGIYIMTIINMLKSEDN